MLGISPLAGAPLAGRSALITLVAVTLSATGSITFGGSAVGNVRTPISATGGLTLGGSATPTITVYKTVTGGITFGADADLTLAGKPLVFNAIPRVFTFRSDGRDFTFKAVPRVFTFRGAK